MAQITSYNSIGKATQELRREGLFISHRSLPINSKVRVLNTVTGKEVEVTVTGRISRSENQIADVSPRVWQELALTPETDIRVYTVPSPVPRSTTVDPVPVQPSSQPAAPRPPAAAPAPAATANTTSANNTTANATTANTTPTTPAPSPPPPPYTVKVTANALNIRKGAGTDTAVVGVIADKGVYTITEEKPGVGASLWGRLKSGAGWISLDYVVRR
jgi:hypothetical protein